MRLGENIFTRIVNTLKSSGQSALDSAKADLLRQGGTAIAQTPQGQQGIQAELLKQGKVIASNLPWGLIAVGVVAFVVLSRKRR